MSAVTIDADLARRLIAAQFPQWAGLPVAPVRFGGWDNRTFHLGPEMLVRLPSAARYAAQAEKEHLWLPRLAPRLPLAIPASLALGGPGEGYPWPWSVRGWIDGETAQNAAALDLTRVAVDLAGFLVALEGIDPGDGPPPGAHCFMRGGSLATYDAETRAAIAALAGEIDTPAVTGIWEDALAAVHCSAPVWLHGDVAPGNLLVRDGALSAVIDFGLMAVGDPACDLAIAWTFFEGESRRAFRAARGLDEAAWARGRGWALWKALIVRARSAGANAAEYERSGRVLAELIADHKTAR